MKYPSTSIVSSKRGITLLIAVLISAVVLTVGMGVYQRTYKEVLFASFWKQTQLALTAADSGLECALYWDLHTPAPPGASASCFGSGITWLPGSTVANTSLDTYGGCVKITITKPAPVPSTLGTLIEARGYNASCAVLSGGTGSNLRLVERGLSVTY